MHTNSTQKGYFKRSLVNGAERTHVCEFSLARVNLMFGACNEEVRSIVKGDLRRRGFTGVRDMAGAGALEQALDDQCPDLLICELDLPNGDICDMVRSIRNERIGRNPFMLVIVMLKNPTVERIRQVVEAGSDDIVVSPVSVAALNARIMNLIHKRKPFVVTTDYIGPTRRKAPRPGCEVVPLIDVPNTARLKIERSYSESELQKLIDQTALVINRQKLERHAVQVSYQVDRVMEVQKQGRPGTDLRRPLEKLSALALDIERRLAAGEHSEVAKMCQSLRNVSDSLLETLEAPDPRAIELLPPIAAAIETAFEVKRKIADAARDISLQVDRRFRSSPAAAGVH